MSINRTEHIVIALLTLIIAVAGLQTGIFWDNLVFITNMGDALQMNGLLAWGSLPIPADPGHPLLPATLVAAAWNLFGRSLLVSHIVMWPFIYGVLWQVFRFCRFFLHNDRHTLAAFLLLMADPTLLSQLTLVSPEVLLLFFALLALNAILYQQHLLKTVALAFLGLVSLRGMMVCGGLFLIDLWFNRRQFLNRRNLLSYAIGALPAVSFVVWRLIAKGWIIDNPMNTWGDATGYDSPIHFLRNVSFNCIVLAHRFLDFGRIVPMLFVVTMLIVCRPKDRRISQLVAIAILSTIVVSLSSICIINTMGHRYYILSYLSIHLMAFILLLRLHHRHTWYTILIGSLVAGNFIIYPDKTAQGWDSSLAQLNYWHPRRQMLQYIDENHISVAHTATFFPNWGIIDMTDLNGDTRSFIDFTGNEPYVFYSNVFNLSDEDYELLHRNYVLVQSYSQLGVRVELYSKTSHTGNEK